MSLLSEYIYVQCKKCKWAPITAFQCLRLNEVPFSQSINYRFISNSTVYKRTYAVRYATSRNKVKRRSVWINCSSDLKDSANSRPSASNFGYFLDHWPIYSHRRAEQFWKQNIIIMNNFCLKMFSTFPNTKLPIELILADVLSDQTDLRPLDLWYEKVVFLSEICFCKNSPAKRNAAFSILKKYTYLKCKIFISYNINLKASGFNQVILSLLMYARASRLYIWVSKLVCQGRQNREALQPFEADHFFSKFYKQTFPYFTIYIIDQYLKGLPFKLLYKKKKNPLAFTENFHSGSPLGY